MIEVQVPKDVNSYSTPLIGPLTGRQAAGLAIAAVVEYVYYNVLRFLNVPLDLESSSMTAVLCIGVLLAAPILYIAGGSAYGMQPDAYIFNYLIPSLLAPKDRPYETKLLYDSLLEEIDKAEEAEELAKSGGKSKKKKEEEKKKPKKKKPKGKQDIMYA